LAAWLGYGYYRQATITEAMARSPRINTAVIQGNIRQGDKWDPQVVQATLETYARLTRQTLEGKNGKKGRPPPSLSGRKPRPPFFSSAIPAAILPSTCSFEK
jgi:apolipoprotein N-acyltransferase